MPNDRLQKLMKERNIPPLKIPPKAKRAYIKLRDINDPRLPKTIAEELQLVKDDILEIAHFVPTTTNSHAEYRVTLKFNDDFNSCIFYTVK